MVNKINFFITYGKIIETLELHYSIVKYKLYVYTSTHVPPPFVNNQLLLFLYCTFNIPTRWEFIYVGTYIIHQWFPKSEWCRITIFEWNLLTGVIFLIKHFHVYVHFLFCNNTFFYRLPLVSEIMYVIYFYSDEARDWVLVVCMPKFINFFENLIFF